MDNVPLVIAIVIIILFVVLDVALIIGSSKLEKRRGSVVNPINCVGCRNLYYLSDGSVECKRPDNGKTCIKLDRIYYEEDRNGYL